MAKSDPFNNDSLAESTPQELHYLMGKLGMAEEQDMFEKEMVALQSKEADKERDVLKQYDSISKKGSFAAGITSLTGAIVAGAIAYLAGKRQENWGKLKKNALTIGGGLAGATTLNAITSIPVRKQLGGIRTQIIEGQGVLAEELMGIMSKYARMVDERMQTTGIENPADLAKMPEAAMTGGDPIKTMPPETTVMQTGSAETTPAMRLQEARAEQALPQQQAKGMS